MVSPSQHPSRWRCCCLYTTDTVCREASGQCAGTWEALVLHQGQKGNVRDPLLGEMIVYLSSCFWELVELRRRSWHWCLNGAMELRSSDKSWTAAKMGFSGAELSSSHCKEQLLHWKAQGFHELAPRSASFHWKAILLGFVDWVFPLHKRIILPWHSVLCCFTFQKTLLTIPAESLAVMMSACYKKHVDRWTCCLVLERTNRRQFAI